MFRYRKSLDAVRISILSDPMTLISYDPTKLWMSTAIAAEEEEEEAPGMRRMDMMQRDTEEIKNPSMRWVFNHGT